MEGGIVAVDVGDGVMLGDGSKLGATGVSVKLSCCGTLVGRLVSVTVTVGGKLVRFSANAAAILPKMRSSVINPNNRLEPSCCRACLIHIPLALDYICAGNRQ